VTKNYPESDIRARVQPEALRLPRRYVTRRYPVRCNAADRIY
jgi:hypothetical protein